MPVREEIVTFADAMEFKMRSKEKVKGDAWKTLTIDRLFDLLKGEVEELREAVAGGNVFEIMAEGADVGNFAMMVVHTAIRSKFNGPTQSEARPLENQAQDQGCLELPIGCT